MFTCKAIFALKLWIKAAQLSRKLPNLATLAAMDGRDVILEKLLTATICLDIMMKLKMFSNVFFF